MIDNYEQYPCDLCKSEDAVEVPHCREYTDDQPIHICVNCGFVHVKNRRSFKEIAEDWSEEIFGDGYTAVIPAVQARLTYVMEFTNKQVGLDDKTVCDIGAGEGVLLDMIRNEYNSTVFGIEPSGNNCERMRELDINCFQGTIEEYNESEEAEKGWADVVTITWTLEACQSCRSMLKAAHEIIKPGGHLIVATGSRLLVPFKKPLHYYLSTNPVDTHPFRFSANTLQGILAETGFETEALNRYIDSDPMCIVGKKVDQEKKISWEGDNYLEVYNFFQRWHEETEIHYKDA